MTEPLSPPPSEAAPPARAPRVRRLPMWLMPLLIIMIAAIALLVWQWVDTRHELRRVQDELARRVGESIASSTEAGTLARQAQENVQTLQAKTVVIEAQMAESQGQQAALESLYKEFSSAHDERTLTQAAQAINIASQQLQLASNVPAALSALQSADATLASLDRPQLLPVRKLIARDIDRLRALPLADADNMSLTLEAMLGRVDSLPLGFEHSPAPQVPVPPAKPAAKAAAPSASAPIAAPDQPNWISGFFGDLWQEFRQLIRIERLDRPDPALLSPQQAVYLRENLRLRLLSARLALLQRDGKVFNEDVRQARQWLERYFDVQSRPVAGMVAELRQIEGARLSVDLPSLDETETALRGVKLGSR